jgi:photosystem II stability/assembly factor-like uncharacterized protein
MNIRLLIASLVALLTANSINAQWYQQTQVTIYDLNSVHCVNDSTCYAVGFKTNVFKTVDGGATPWFKPGGTTGIADKLVVKMLNKDTVLIGQVNGTMKMTTNGSTNSDWSADIVINQGSNGLSYCDIAFNSKTNFAAVGGSIINTSSGGKLVATSVNSGAAWNLIGTGSGEPTIFGMENITTTKYVAAGGAKTIYRSTNAGLTWTKIMTGGVDTTLFDINFPTPAIGYAVGGTPKTPATGGIIFKTIDSGKTWTKANVGALPALNTLYGVHFVTKDTGYVVGNGGIILVTVNAGVNWTKQISPVSTDLNKVYFPSKKVGYIVGKNGVILKTTDGGFIPPLVLNPISNASVCPGFCATIGGTLVASGGTPPYKYAWAPVVNSNSSVVVCPSANTTYTLTVTDANNSIAKGKVTVSIYTVAPVTFSGLPLGYCLNGNNLTLAGSPSGGQFSGAGITGNSFSPAMVGSGTYTVSYTYTDANGCIKTASTKSVTVTSKPAATSLCMVTVDSSTSTRNIVVWQKPVSNSIDSFRVYRKNAAGGMTRLKAVSYNDSPEYVDAGTLVNPKLKSYAYAVAVVDTCGMESALSDTNRTIFLHVPEFILNGIVLRWDDCTGFIPNEYEVWRKDSEDPSWVIIGTVPYWDENQYIDSLSPLSSSRYRIQAAYSAGCMINQDTTMYATVSNMTADYTAVTEKSLDNLLNVYPNPNHGTFTFLLAGVKFQTAQIRMYDIVGKLVYESALKNQKADISLPEIARGIYQLKVITDKGTANKKIIIQ